MKLSPKIPIVALVAVAVLAGVCVLSGAQTNSSQAAGAKFSYGGDAAETPAQFIDNLVFLSARVNSSAPSLFQLDTTAQSSSIAPARAEEIGHGSSPAPVLNLEGVDVTLPALPIRASDNFGARVGEVYQGTLGSDFLSCVVLEIDYGRQTVRAFSNDAYKYSGKGTIFPLKLQQGVPVIPAQFALAKGKAIQGNFVINTALDASVLLSNKFLAGRKMFSDRGRVIPAIDPISGNAGASMGKLHGFRMGQITPEDVLITFSDSALPEVGTPLAGEIGADILRRFVVVFDFAHQRLIFTPNLRFPDPDQEDKSGLLIVGKGPDYKRFEVVGVEPHTPAADAGIEKGDVIAGVDAEAAADLSLLVTRDLFKQVGHKYKLLVEHNGATKDVTLQMRRYF